MVSTQPEIRRAEIFDEYDAQRGDLLNKCRAAKLDCASRISLRIDKLALLDVVWSRSLRRLEIQALMDGCVGEIAAEVRQSFDLVFDEPAPARAGTGAGPRADAASLATIVLGFFLAVAALLVAFSAQDQATQSGLLPWQSSELFIPIFLLLGGVSLALATLAPTIVKAAVKRLKARYKNFVDSELDRRIVAGADTDTPSVFCLATTAMEQRARKYLESIR